jgi:CP family cyanate transporter-like MFS transporter
MPKMRRTFLIALGILLIGANLRIPISMIPPMLPELKAAIGLQPALAGLLTTIPLIMFALASPIMGHLGGKHSNERVLLVALLILSVGSYLRVLPSVGALIGGTILVGIGIAGGNVLLPAIIKDQFPNSVAAKTTMYTSAQMLLAAFGTGTAGILAKQAGPFSAMGIFSLIGIAGLLVWLLAMPGMRQKLTKTTHTEAATSGPTRSVWKSPLAWVIMIFFGMQSILYYTLMTWLPSLWQAAGFSVTAAGSLTTVFMLGGLPASLLVPSIAERRHGLSILNAAVFGGFFIGAASLLLGNTNYAFNFVMSLLMGLASGASFSLAVAFFQKRTDHAADTARLSGMAQAGGYVLAAIGPVGIGIVEQATHSWTLLIYLTLLITLLIGIAGVLVIRKRSIFD